MAHTEDPHQFVNSLEDAAVQKLIQRLENRGRDDVFTNIFNEYISQVDLTGAPGVLEVGCGTGVILRALARRSGFRGKCTGVDQSPKFIEVARQFTRDENLSDKITFQTGDAHQLEFPDNTFDIVLAHTVISHVAEYHKFLQELSRVTGQGKTVVIFDGDYHSLTFGHPDLKLGRAMDNALARATFKNPTIMRELPSLLPGYNFKLEGTVSRVVSEIGTSSYFKTFAETYAPFVYKSGILSRDEVDAWLQVQLKAMEANEFFASCNYYAYQLKKI